MTPAEGKPELTSKQLRHIEEVKSNIEHNAILANLKTVEWIRQYLEKRNWDANQGNQTNDK